MKNEKKINVNRKNASVKSDIWQIGVLLYEMITEYMPFNESNVIKGLESGKIDYSVIERDYPILKDMVEMMLKVNPNERADIKSILAFKDFSDIAIIYQLTPIEQDDDVLNRGNRQKSPQEELIFEYKKENEKLKIEVEKMKNEINTLTKENIEIKNRSKQIEDLFNSPNTEMTEQIVGYKSQIRLLNNEITIKKMSLQEEKDKVNELTEQINELQKEIEENNISHDAIVSDLQRKIENLEARLFGTDNPQSTSDFLQYYLPIFNESVKDFKNIIDKTVIQAEISSDNFITKFKSMLDEKEKGFKDINNALKDAYENSNFFKINLSDIENKANSEKDEWFQKQIKELIPFKNKCLRLEEAKEKIDKENSILKERLKLIEEKCDNLQQIQELSSDQLKKEVNTLKTKIKDSSDFVLKHCPEKFDQFKHLIKLN